jgi:exonuclease III
VVSSSVSNKSCGTAILVRDTHKVNKVIRDEEGRFVQVHLEADEHLLSFVSLYAPNKNPERNRFFSSIPELIDLSRPTFICGDFNSVLDSALDRKRRSSYTGSQAAQYQESGPALQSLLSATQTYPLWRTLHQGQTAYSWTHGSGQFATRIDMVWAPTVFQDNIKEWEYHPSFFSDHSYLLVKFELEQNFRGPGVWKFNNSLLDDPEYCDLVASYWSFWQSREGSEEYSSLLDWWDQGKY